MKEPFTFASRLAERMIQFIAFKRMQGYDYTASAACLKHFDTFLSNHQKASKGLCGEELDGYRAQIKGLKRASVSGRLSVVRQFSLYLRAVVPESVVLSKHLIPRQPRSIRFCPLRPDQVGALLAETAIDKSASGIRAECIRFFIGLLYCTGLRVSEALALNLADVDLDQATLFVRQGKFRKERLVPMSPSVVAAMRQWLSRRAPYAGNGHSAPLFVAAWNKRLDRYQAFHAFRRRCVRCGLNIDPPPRLHDLRHNYACRCIARWREDGENVDALLPVLANAMGHVDFHATEVYIHIDAETLRQACANFYRHINNPPEHSK